MLAVAVVSAEPLLCSLGAPHGAGDLVEDAIRSGSGDMPLSPATPTPERASGSATCSNLLFKEVPPLPTAL